MTPEEARRQLRAKAHRDADRQTARFAQISVAVRDIGTVTTVIPGGASDGTDLFLVTWRNGESTAAGRNDTGSFAVGDRVLFDLIDGQLILDYRIVGQP